MAAAAAALDTWQAAAPRRRRRRRREVAAGDPAAEPEADREVVLGRIREAENDLLISNFWSSALETISTCLRKHLEQLKAPVDTLSEALGNLHLDPLPSESDLAPGSVPGETLVPGTCHLRCVCYGIGNFATCIIARNQLTFLLLFLEKCQIPRSHCWVYDPLFSHLEIAILNALGVTVISENEEGGHVVSVPRDEVFLAGLEAVLGEGGTGTMEDYRTITVVEPSARVLDPGKLSEGKRSICGKPTIFYMIHCGTALYNNLLWSNWSVDALSKVIIIGNSFRGLEERFLTRILQKNYPYIAKILKGLEELEFPQTSQYMDIFNDTSIHWFPVQKLTQLSKDTWVFREEPYYQDVEDLEIIRNKTEDPSATDVTSS